jgi:hypothetical protein
MLMTASLNIPQESRYCSVKDLVADAILGQPLQVHQRLKHALATRSIEAPEQHECKFPARSRFEQRFELFPATVFASGNVNVFARDVPALTGRKRAELVELVLVVLLFGRDAAIDCDVHNRYLRTGQNGHKRSFWR